MYTFGTTYNTGHRAKLGRYRSEKQTRNEWKKCINCALRAGRGHVHRKTSLPCCVSVPFKGVVGARRAGILGENGVVGGGWQGA